MDAKLKLPEYENPPVTEVVLGIQFDPLDRFTVVHPGLYWLTLKDKYPTVSAQPPLNPDQEAFDGEIRQAENKVELLSVPPLPRCWFVDTPNNKLVQIQRDRLLHNWRKVTGLESYPRYESISQEFKSIWADFLRFAKNENLGTVKPNHWEVTYVNHLPKKGLWDSAGDFSKIFSNWAGKSSGTFLPTPENISFKLSYVFPEKRGRLHIVVDPAYRLSDKSMIIRLTLTARGKIESSDPNSVMANLDQGHEWIVNGFTDFTTPEAHKFWKRKE